MSDLGGDVDRVGKGGRRSGLDGRGRLVVQSGHETNDAALVLGVHSKPVAKKRKERRARGHVSEGSMRRAGRAPIGRELDELGDVLLNQLGSLPSLRERLLVRHPVVDVPVRLVKQLQRANKTQTSAQVELLLRAPLRGQA